MNGYLKEEEREKLFSTPELRERGWTPSMIKKLMPLHDNEQRNPKYRCAAPMKLYSKTKVYAYERGNRWKTMHEKSLKRIENGKKSSRKALTTKIDNTLKKYENIEFEVPKDIPKEKLERDALRSYNDLHSERSDSFLWVKRSEVDDDFIARITVNYIRHQLTEYDSVIEIPRQHVGVNEARCLIKGKVLDSIAVAYPYLAGECVDQSFSHFN